MKLTTRRLVVVGMLVGISILLGVTPSLGFIPIGPVKATIMHIPVIIGAIVEGPIVGLIIGLIFGGFSMFQAAAMPTSPLAPLFLDPFVAILPRLLIGPISYYIYIGIKKLLKGSKKIGRGNFIATAIATAVGTLVNTIGVLGMIYVRHAAEYAAKMGIDPSTVGNVIFFGIALPNGIPEALVAVLIVTAVIQALKKVYKTEF